MLKRGLYEQVINKSLDRELECSDDIVTSTGKLDGAEAPQILSHYISELVEKGLRQVSSDDISGQLSLANRIVSAIADVTGDSDFDGMSVAERAEQLLAVAEKKNTLTVVTGEFSPVRPETSLAASSLFTGSIHEPSMMSELKKEIQSADRVDMLVSFVKWSGLRLIIDELSEFTQRGGKLRVITTSYMGATTLKQSRNCENSRILRYEFPTTPSEQGSTRKPMFSGVRPDSARLMSARRTSRMPLFQAVLNGISKSPRTTSPPPSTKSALPLKATGTATNLRPIPRTMCRSCRRRFQPKNTVVKQRITSLTSIPIPISRRYSTA